MGKFNPLHYDESTGSNSPAGIIKGSTPTLEPWGSTLTSQSSWVGVSFSPKERKSQKTRLQTLKQGQLKPRWSG